MYRFQRMCSKVHYLTFSYQLPQYRNNSTHTVVFLNMYVLLLVTTYSLCKEQNY